MKAGKITEVQITHFDEDLQAYCIDAFGTGDNGGVVGYIMPDGRVLIPDPEIRERCKDAIIDFLSEIAK